MSFKLLLLLLNVILLTTACDLLTQYKSLSEKVDDCSIKQLASPIQDERIQTKPKVKTIKPIVEIPQKFKRRVSLLINETLPLKSVLYEVSKQLNINIQIDPDINSNVIFRANNKPFIEVVDAICDIANLRYTIQNDFIKIEKDLPYSQNYDVQCLNLSRDSENKIAIATEVTGSRTSSSNNNSTSDSTVTFKAKSEFWDDLSKGIGIILSSDNKNKYSINKQSGIITIYANSKTQRAVQEYIDKIKEVTNSQVLIEAKIIEVVLNNEYKRGINWNLLFNKSNAITKFVNSDGNVFSFTHSNINNTKDSHSVESILKALEQFGSVRTISNPRITTMNNQAAVIKIAENQVYFKLNCDKVYSNRDSLREDVNISSDIKTIPIGLVMFVQPSIDIKNGVVSLFLRPTITKLQDTVNDPAVDIAIANNREHNIYRHDYPKSKIPITEVREVASVLKLHDGEVAVLGGFMEVISAKSKSGLPVIRDVPVLGELASGADTKDKVVELVILVKVKISEPSTLQKAADIRLQRFVPDPRPF